MNAKVVGFVAGAIVLMLVCRGCMKQERRATLCSMVRSMPDCDTSTVMVDEDAECITYTTKSGKHRGFSMEWENGKPRLCEFFW